MRSNLFAAADSNLFFGTQNLWFTNRAHVDLTPCYCFSFRDSFGCVPARGRGSVYECSSSSTPAAFGIPGLWDSLEPELGRTIRGLYF